MVYVIIVVYFGMWIMGVLVYDVGNLSEGLFGE